MPDALADGIWTVPQVDGPPRYSAPLPQTSALYVVDQDYVCEWDDFIPTALNAPFDIDGTYYLVEEQQPSSPGAAIRKWTRRYAQVPASWSEPGGNYAYNFIGIESDTLMPTGRSRQVLIVPMRIQRDYYLIGPGGSYATVEAMVAAQTIPQQVYTLTLYPSSFVQVLTQIGASIPTTPSTDQYLSWVTTKTEITVDTSVFVRWNGNIWCRETRYVQAR